MTRHALAAKMHLLRSSARNERESRFLTPKRRSNFYKHPNGDRKNSGASHTVILKMDAQALDAAIESAITRLGYESLRPKQKLAVQSFVQGRDVFVSLPTGSGKSLCYWLLPSVFEHLRGIPEK